MHVLILIANQAKLSFELTNMLRGGQKWQSNQKKDIKTVKILTHVISVRKRRKYSED